jgi:hypothetical protein
LKFDASSIESRRKCLHIIKKYGDFMAVQNHPKYPEYIDALENYLAASDAYNLALRNGEPVAVVRKLQNVMIGAQNLHISLGNEVGCA